MRPQPISFGMAASEDDLGWNDMGEIVGPDAAAVPPVLVERANLVREVEAPVAVPESEAKRVSPATAARLARESAAATAERKAAFTLRLDTDRHLRLRLSAALAGRSAQQLVTEALDAFLCNRPGLDEIVAGLPQSARKRS